MLDIFGVFSEGTPILDYGETANMVECGGDDTGEVAFESQADGGGGLGEVVVLVVVGIGVDRIVLRSRPRASPNGRESVASHVRGLE
jgi:hypothetical protein